MKIIRCKFAAIGFALAYMAPAQDLAPGVVLLSRIKSHIRGELARTPNYTCLETISRFHNPAGSGAARRVRLTPLDTIRLEVVYSDHREWYSLPGSGNLSQDDLTGFVGGGMIGNGPFASTLNNIIEGASFIYKGEDSLQGRAAVKFDFRLPPMAESLTVSVPGGSGTVGEEGSVWADPQSLDLIRLEYRADEIPPYLPLTEESSSVKYERVEMSGHSVLLAQEAGLHMRETNGTENFDRFEFSHCHAYTAESEIQFDSEPPQAAQVPPGISTGVQAAPRGVAGTIPALLAVTVVLTTPVTDKDIVGAPIEGRISGDVLRKGKILLRDGSPVRGRIRRLERYNRETFIVGLEFTEVVATGSESALFYADLIRIDKSPLVKPTLSEHVLVNERNGVQTSEETVTLPELPGVASFFIAGRTFTIPSGFRTVWRTRGPVRGSDPARNTQDDAGSSLRPPRRTR